MNGLTAPALSLPDSETVSARLSSILSEYGLTTEPVVVMKRTPSPQSSTFPAEVVHCRLSNGRLLLVYCKYSCDRNHLAHGHRSGIGYEAKVYQNILRSSGMTVADFYGAYTRRGESSWLLIEYLQETVRVSKASVTDAMARAAQWIGEFHAVNSTKGVGSRLDFLNVYDAEYYLGWAERALLYTEPFHQRFPWIEQVCRRFESALDTLLAAPTTIIHGEYYPNNILARGTTIYPVDWESAARAPGEIDLASLVEAWDAETIQCCRHAYLRARWGTSLSSNFDGTFSVAQLYWHLRWLGERPGWPNLEGRLRHIRGLRVQGEQLGLL